VVVEVELEPVHHPVQCQVERGVAQDLDPAEATLHHHFYLVIQADPAALEIPVQLVIPDLLEMLVLLGHPQQVLA
jgi:hypothetical protein